MFAGWVDMLMKNRDIQEIQYNCQTFFQTDRSTTTKTNINSSNNKNNNNIVTTASNAVEMTSFLQSAICFFDFMSFCDFFFNLLEFYFIFIKTTKTLTLAIMIYYCFNFININLFCHMISQHFSQYFLRFRAFYSYMHS